MPMWLMANTVNNQRDSCCLRNGYLGVSNAHKRHKILQIEGKLFILCSTSLFEIISFSTTLHKLYEYKMVN